MASSGTIFVSEYRYTGSEVISGITEKARRVDKDTHTGKNLG